MLSLNSNAQVACKPLVDCPDKYGVIVEHSKPGATIIDCGIQTKGSLDAGLVFSTVCLAGLGSVGISDAQLGNTTYPVIKVLTKNPVEACMAGQYAGWAIKQESFFGMGSGPARALYAGEELFKEIDHKEKSDTAVLCIETRDYPTDKVVEYICGKTGVSPDRLTILLAPTASQVGSVQISARIVETAIHKMHEVGFDLSTIKSGSGMAPIAPVADDDLTAIGRTNDCILYGGEAEIHVDCDDEFLESKIDEIPSCSSKDYGKTFLELFKEYGDFYSIDPLLFSPAVISVHNVQSGNVYKAGKMDFDLLNTSLAGR